MLQRTSTSRPSAPTLPTLEHVIGDADIVEELDDLGELEELEDLDREDTDRSPALRVCVLSVSDHRDLARARKAAAARTRLGLNLAPEAVVAEIARVVRNGARGANEDARADLAYELGVLWGDQLARAAGWQWVELSWDAGAAPALVSRDRSHACFPTRVVADALEAGRASLVELTFRRVRGSEHDGARPGDLAVIG